ncbi:MAG: radical SAM protein [Patescibacteria group bacterium]
MDPKRSEKIILISPPSSWIYGDIPYPPLGIATLSAMTKQAVGTYPTIIDGQLSDYKDRLKKTLTDTTPLVVGISSTLLQLPKALKVAKQFKSKNKNTMVIIGGAAPSCMSPANFFKYSEDVVDAIVFGEGDYTWQEITQKILGDRTLKTNKLLKNIQGTAFKVGSDIVVNTPRPRITQLDKLPMPDFDGIRAQEYINLWKKNGGFGSISIFPSRGCPFLCTFCDKSVFGNRFVHQSPKRIADEMHRITKKFYNLDEIFLFDDNLSTNEQVMINLCEQIEKRCLNVRWSVQARVDTVNEKMLKKMYHAGCRDIYFGIETASKKLLEFIKKGFSVEQAKETVRLCHKVGINPGAFFIVGIPGETKQDIETIAKFIKEVKPKHIGFSVLTPFPGTQLYKNTQQLIRPELLNKYEAWDDTRRSVYKKGTFEVDPKMSIQYLDAIFHQTLKENKMSVDQSQFVIKRYD